MLVFQAHSFPAVLEQRTRERRETARLLRQLGTESYAFLLTN